MISIMKYNYTIEVAHQDVDRTRRWRLHNMENALLQVAGDVANSLGFGTDALLELGYTWILSRMEISMTRLPKHGEKVTFETWIESNAHMLSTRNYRLYIGEDTTGEMIGKVSSIWAVLDLQSRQVVYAFDQPMFVGCVDGERLEMERIPRLRPMSECNGQRTYTIVYSDIDYNGHCNSCKYLEHMLDSSRPAFMDEDKPFRLSLQYSKEVMEGEQVSIEHAVGMTDTQQSYVQWQMKNSQGETSAMARYIQL